MSDGIEREEFYHALAAVTKAVDSGFAGVNARLDRINGQVGTNTTRIAVLEDRSGHGGRNGALAGGGIAAAIWAAIELLPKMFARP